MFIIDKNGTGQFTSLQAAIDAAPSDAHHPVILLLRAGEYEEPVRIHKDNLRIIGEDRAVISGPLAVTGSSVEIENIVLRSERVSVSRRIGEGEAADRLPTWYLCGDSTMEDCPPAKYPLTGWGQALKLLVEDAHVENCAIAGRSSKSFVEQKQLSYIELCLREGDKLFIQFGHNDEKTDPERATDPHTTFQEYLNLYIDAARRHGAEPILLTPIARRHFDEHGQLKHTHGEYPEAMRKLARQRGVRLLDMERATEKLLSDMGELASRKLFNWQEKGHPNYPDGVQDNSHLCFDGAMQIAQIALQLLQESEDCGK